MNETFQRGWGGGCLTNCGKSGGMGGYSLLQKTENPGKRGVLSEIPSVVGVWIFSGTTQYVILLFFVFTVTHKKQELL